MQKKRARRKIRCELLAVVSAASLLSGKCTGQTWTGGNPDATGYELMEQIRDRYGIKGIALSGYGMDDDMRESREAGFVDHIVKPVNFAQPEAVIRRVTSAEANGA
jgi:hypothetical protein